MKAILILILMLSSACASPTYVTKHGIKVFDETTHITPTQQEVEAVTDFVIRYLGNAKHLKNAKLMLVSVWLHLPQPNGGVALADGYTNIWDKEMIASVFQTCFADSGAVHEMAHIIHDYKSYAPDWFHDDKGFWNGTVKEMERVIIEELCPEGYEHKKIPPTYVPPEEDEIVNSKENKDDEQRSENDSGSN